MPEALNSQHHQSYLQIETRGRGFTAINGPINRWLEEIGATCGVITIFCRHTSASLTIQENADPDVLLDLETFFTKLIPDGAAWLRHTMEGSDDMPAHIRTALTDTTLNIPVSHGSMTLGTWQDVYLIEHRKRPQTRCIVLHYSGICS